MNKEQLAALTDEELITRAKQIKKTRLYDTVIFGFLMGIAIYSSVVNGFGLLTFLPLVYIPIAAKNKATIKTLDKLLQERNLS